MASGDIVVAQDNRSGRLSYWQGRSHQSLADRDGISLAPYIHALYGLIRQSGAKRVLVIGCGGGTLATMLARAKVQVTVVDKDARAFEIARRYFHMPDVVECHVDDGARFLRRHPRRYDAIVLDAFAGGQIPSQLASLSFFSLAKARLRAKGLFLANIVAVDSLDPGPARWQAKLMQVWRRVRLLDTEADTKRDRGRNAIILAGAVKSLKPPRLLLKPAAGASSLAQALARFVFTDVFAGVAAKPRTKGFMRARYA